MDPRLGTGAHPRRQMDCRPFGEATGRDTCRYVACWRTAAHRNRHYSRGSAPTIRLFQQLRHFGRAVERELTGRGGVAKRTKCVAGRAMRLIAHEEIDAAR